ncbi:MAG TPA: hybrid sensor histidine kinase/response regulator, partial [Cyanobacteria bacterium UBA11049]|nr:hybrid sensor histidine kinase/response regulator [Cyanobacteria bacterium UBA11049]
MAKTKYILRDFIATVPSCVQTTPLAIVVNMLSQGQSDRAVVLDRQQYPIGVLQMRRLMPQLMQLFTSGDLETKHLWDVAESLVEPIGTLPVDLDLEEFKSYLNSHQEQIDTTNEWALIDSEGKYVGLLESNRLWKVLAFPEQEIDREPPDRLVEMLAQNYGIELYKLDLLVQLLERLPLPLMLQTGKGEAIAQNPAWGQQFGTLSDPEEVSLEVEAILKTGLRSQKKAGDAGGEIPIQNPLATRGRDTATNESLSHCKLGNQPGTCICSWPGQNGQERVWQFLKIPLPMTVNSNRPEDEQIWLLLANDVTEQQQMASELAAKNADLIQLNRLKDEFLACISHELRTPLTAMLGLSTLLKDQALGQLNERQVRYARLIHENGRHLMSVVNDILDLTRMETGQMELTLEPVGIRKVCDRAIEQARAAMQPKTSQAATLAGKKLTDNFTDHRFTLLIEPGLESIVADELRLRQMLIHLLANAFKFTELGGEIGLRVSYWAGWIAFTVWDTGIGIPEHQQHLIFQKFQQLENPLNRQFEGTGLGLVLTRALARLHGGDVSFLSQEGKGSQFTLLLPPNPPNKKAGGSGGAGGEWETEGAGGAIPDRASSRSSRKPYARVARKSIIQNSSRHLPNSENCCNNHLVLVVEAAPRFIEELTEQLTSLGYWVVIARSGTEALEKARRLQPGAILLNPLLPLLSGWDVLTLIKSDAATNQIPVIVTTTRAEKDRVFSNRADEFLSLPVKRQVLQKLMTHFCGPPLVSHSKSLTR